jgi:hypothetical protein
MNPTIGVCMILMNIGIALAAVGFEYVSYRSAKLAKEVGYENSDKIMSSFFDAIEGSIDDKEYVSKFINLIQLLSFIILIF